MKYFFLDTCIYVACSLINKEGAHPDLLVALFEDLKRHDEKLLLPDAVLHEYRRKVDIELAKLAKDIDNFAAGGKNLAAAEDKRKLNDFFERLKRDSKLPSLLVSSSRGCPKNTSGSSECRLRQRS